MSRQVDLKMIGEPIVKRHPIGFTTVQIDEWRTLAADRQLRVLAADVEELGFSFVLVVRLHGISDRENLLEQVPNLSRSARTSGAMSSVQNTATLQHGPTGITSFANIVIFFFVRLGWQASKLKQTQQITDPQSGNACSISLSRTVAGLPTTAYPPLRFPVGFVRCSKTALALGQSPTIECALKYSPAVRIDQPLEQVLGEVPKMCLVFGPGLFVGFGDVDRQQPAQLFGIRGVAILLCTLAKQSKFVGKNRMWK